jgi:hypothetical protein
MTPSVSTPTGSAPTRVLLDTHALVWLLQGSERLGPQTRAAVDAATIGQTGVIAVAMSLVFAAFGVHAWSGGAYQARTVGAMVLRTLHWTGIAAFAHRALRHDI